MGENGGNLGGGERGHGREKGRGEREIRNMRERR